MTMLQNAARGARDLLVQTWARRPVWLTTPFTLMTALVLILGYLWLGDLVGERKTLGTIIVGSPAIYTRERLVNDRFLQDTWLSSRLNPPTEIEDSRQYRSERRGGSARIGEMKDAGESEASSEKDQQPRLSSIARLSSDIDYREQVRNLTIENQLDDRHDLNGNSLYRFRFDATVLPGTNTQANALITVRLLSPSFIGSPPRKPLTSLSELADLDAWRSVYRRWIENLHARLNQTHRELMQTYDNNESSHNDYAHLIAFLLRILDVPIGKITKCQSTFVEIQGPRTPTEELSAQEHIARKRCVEAIVEQAIALAGSKAVTNLPVDAEQGQYIEKAKLTTTPEANTPAARARLVETWLNAFFATKTIKLVLGLVVPETSFVGQEFYRIPAFQNLARLTFFKRLRDDDKSKFEQTGARDRDAFEVTERVYSVVAIDPSRVTDEMLTRITSKEDPFYGLKIIDFERVGFAPPDRLRVSKGHLLGLKEDLFTFHEKDFRTVAGSKGFYIANAEVGLVNFVRAASANTLAFTYSVTPRESADSIDLTLSSGARFDANVTAPSSVSAQARRDATSRALERRNAVVGFAGIADDQLHPSFGWAIAPRGTGLDGTRLVYVQTPAQYALSALVSIPSWWSKAEFHITASWVGRDAAPIAGTKRSWKYDVDIPMDFEPLEASLLGIEQLGPEIMESRLDPVLLTACHPGAIVIPGRRLWRSTKVTLGYQIANTISVLPNMKGIIATFNNVENQMTLKEEQDLRKRGSGEKKEIYRAVRVWTSQGSLTLPRPAQIGIPPGSGLDCPIRAEVQKAGKDKETVRTE